ncbi:hypothetical protein ES676_04830 [Bizionia saleffrena]|uniref:Uncharacterized protein n=2 Tax=Bizionia TaxID=283785 RepID=A0A8H2LE95_9FLAO|nr:hypothetical protein [Bizionia saleffrena]TYB76673.1 hypothetical protein ES676_04830 [Bizionia saleffrena]
MILSLLLLNNSFKTSIVYGWYALDIESFVEELCENKDRPELKCNGKCYLNEITANNSAQEKQTLPNLKWDQLVFCQTELTLNEAPLYPVVKRENFQYNILYKSTLFYSIFHPPQV